MGRRDILETFYPTYGSWQWRRTTAYWIAICFVEGALLFLFASGFAWASACGFNVVHNNKVQDRIMKALTAWPSLIGGIFFSVGAYPMCLETANVMRVTDEWRFWPFSVRETLAHLDSCARDSDGGITRIPYYTSLAYFVGTCIYPIGLVTALFTPLQSAWWTQILYVLPFTVGGILFALGGL